MKKTLLVVFLVLAALSAHAETAEWVFIAADEYGIEYYIDKSSIQQEGPYVRAWSKMIQQEGPYVRAWSKMMAPKEGTLEDRLYAFDVVHHEEYDCAERKIRSLKTISYFRDGTYVEAGSGPFSWKRVEPDSVEEKQMRLVCGF
jgi:hypothetical protein